MEEWRDVDGCNGRYLISNLGRVKRVSYDYVDTFKSGRHRHKEEQLIAITHNRNGYYMFDVHIAGKRIRKYLHRELAKAFIPNPNNLPCINHKDENKLNNNIDNLEWCDYYYNNSYGTTRERMVKTRCNNGTWSANKYTDDEMLLILDFSIPSEEVAKKLGRSKHAIVSKRSRCKRRCRST